MYKPVVCPVTLVIPWAHIPEALLGGAGLRIQRSEPPLALQEEIVRMYSGLQQARRTLAEVPADMCRGVTTMVQRGDRLRDAAAREFCDPAYTEKLLWRHAPAYLLHAAVLAARSVAVTKAEANYRLAACLHATMSKQFPEVHSTHIPTSAEVATRMMMVGATGVHEAECLEEDGTAYAHDSVMTDTSDDDGDE